MGWSDYCFKDTLDNRFKNTDDNEWFKCPSEADFRPFYNRLDRRNTAVTRFTARDRKKQLKSYFRKPYFNNWSGTVG